MSTCASQWNVRTNRSLPEFVCQTLGTHFICSLGAYIDLACFGGSQMKPDTLLQFPVGSIAPQSRFMPAHVLTSSPTDVAFDGPYGLHHLC